MTAQLPDQGETITIRWPGGPFDFVMEFECERTPPPPWPGWRFLYGRIVQPENWYPSLWAPMVHLVDGKDADGNPIREWALKPTNFRIAEDGTVVPIS